ncbi:hypothetical protein Tco_0682502 [Tanacetum coccineum]|uniref:Uncharacterized protein n=1 Tax=Tanacetum coccineum TaxID=301880 RepID=A0ABQ4XRC8_9ASTR
MGAGDEVKETDEQCQWRFWQDGSWDKDGCFSTPTPHHNDDQNRIYMLDSLVTVIMDYDHSMHLQPFYRLRSWRFPL